MYNPTSIKNITGCNMRVLWIAALLCLTPFSQAQDLEDVIYKKDGSVLRGILLEQDFENGRYKIQLQGGSLFSVQKDDIEKITKEAPLNAAVSDDGITINIENNPSTVQSPNVEQYTQALSQPEEKHTKHVFFIGTMSKSIKDEDDDGFAYSGINIAYQYSATEHLAFYTAINSGKFDTIIIDGDRYEYEGTVIDENFIQTQLGIMLSSNTYQGWQFYTGLGLFKEKYSNNNNFRYSNNSIRINSYGNVSGSEHYSGTNFLLGMGYSWQTLQVQFRITMDDSDDYKPGYSHSTTNLQLGFNF
jgi:hypothetical protein